MRRSPLLPLLLLAVPVGFWGSSYPLTAIAARHTSALVFAGLRASTATAAVLVALVAFGVRLPRGRTALYAVATGLLSVTFFLFGLSEGTVLAGAANAAVLVNSAPLWVLALARAAGIERIHGLRVVGLVVGFGGVVAMVSSELGGGGSDVPAGIALALGAAVAWAGSLLVVKVATGHGERFDPLGFTAAQYLAGGPLLLAIGAPSSGGTDWGSGVLWLLVATVGIGSTAGIVAFFSALRRLTATQVSAVQFLVPAVAVVIEAARGNLPGGVTLAGMALAVAGVALVNLPADAQARARRRRAAAVSPPPTTAARSTGAPRP